MLDALVLRSLITTTIGGMIGTYTKPNGSTTPAIGVLPDPKAGYNYPPKEIAVSGTEVLIMKPLNGLTPLIGNQPMISPQWEIRFRQREPNGSAIDAANVLTPVLSKDLDCIVGMPRLIPPDWEKGIPEQVIIRLTEYSI